MTAPDLNEQVSNFVAKRVEEAGAKRAEFRARMSEDAPEMLAHLDTMKALYGENMRVEYMVTRKYRFGKIGEAEAEEIRAGFAEQEVEPAPRAAYRGRR